MTKACRQIVLTRAEALRRLRAIAAEVAGGKAAYYKNGTGGRDPSAKTPFNDKRQCDCSGMACWGIGIDRLQITPGGKEKWFDTSGIILAAKSVKAAFHDWFEIVEPGETAYAGDLMVYGDYKDANGKHHEGHVSVISELLPGFVWNKTRKCYTLCKVIHCSPSNSKRLGTGHAVAECTAKMAGFHRPTKDETNPTLIVRPTFLGSE